MVKIGFVTFLCESGSKSFGFISCSAACCGLAKGFRILKGENCSFEFEVDTTGVQ